MTLISPIFLGVSLQKAPVREVQYLAIGEWRTTFDYSNKQFASYGKVVVVKAINMIMLVEVESRVKPSTVQYKMLCISPRPRNGSTGSSS